MESDFARAWCDLIAHICHLSATAPAALVSEGVRRQYARTLMEILVSAAPHNFTDSIDEHENRAAAWHVRRARIDALHRDLLEADATEGVTTLMMNLGIVNFGRYAQYYREQIGVSPSTTLREKAQ